MSYKCASILLTYVLFTNPRLSLTSEITIPIFFFFLDPLMPIISHAHPQLYHPSPHSLIIIPTTFSLSSSTPYVIAPSSLGRDSGSGVFLLQHSGEPHALHTLRNAVVVHFHRSLVVHRCRVRILHTAHLLWELRGGDVEDGVRK